jgi:hypothetical protein
MSRAWPDPGKSKPNIINIKDGNADAESRWFPAGTKRQERGPGKGPIVREFFHEAVTVSGEPGIYLFIHCLIAGSLRGGIFRLRDLLEFSTRRESWPAIRFRSPEAGPGGLSIKTRVSHKPDIPSGFVRHCKSFFGYRIARSAGTAVRRGRHDYACRCFYPLSPVLHGAACSPLPGPVGAGTPSRLCLQSETTHPPVKAGLRCRVDSKKKNAL